MGRKVCGCFSARTAGTVTAIFDGVFHIVTAALLILSAIYHIDELDHDGYDWDSDHHDTDSRVYTVGVLGLLMLMTLIRICISCCLCCCVACKCGCVVGYWIGITLAEIVISIGLIIVNVKIGGIHWSTVVAVVLLIICNIFEMFFIFSYRDELRSIHKTHDHVVVAQPVHAQQYYPNTNGAGAGQTFTIQVGQPQTYLHQQAPYPVQPYNMPFPQPVPPPEYSGPLPETPVYPPEHSLPPPEYSAPPPYPTLPPIGHMEATTELTKEKTANEV